MRNADPSAQDLPALGTAALHALVYQRLLPALVQRHGTAAAAEHLLRFKVLGGLGPAATADFLQELLAITPAHNDRQHLRLDVKIDPFIGGDAPVSVTQAAVADLLGDGPEPTAFCLTCNSAHWRIAQVQYDRGRVGFVSMVDATVHAVADRLPPGRPVGLLATGKMVRSGLYHDAFARAGYTVVTPDDTLQQHVDAAIYGGMADGRHVDGVKGGDTGAGGTALVQAAVDQLVHVRGAGALCLSCTELPLLFGAQRDGSVRGQAHGVPVVNSTRALAHAFLRHCLLLQARHLLAPARTLIEDT